jgi:hypothetical protein
LAVCVARRSGNPATCHRHAATGADLAIEQLDWVINYLHRIRKSEIANALQKNRRAIVSRNREY